MASHVTLNVGGKQYLTMRSTLQRYPDSYFGKLFDDTVSPAKNEKGHYLIDRDGKIFRHVLNFLRCGKLVLPNGFCEYDLLKCEAEFYSLVDLKNAIKERLKIGLRVGGTIIKITTEEASKEPDSFFAKMLSGQISVPRDTLGNFIIDRDEGVIQLVLRYLQCGGIVFETTPEQLDRLKREGEFFGLQMLLHHIESIQFMQQQIIKGSTPMYLHLFYHEEKQCVVYANKAVLSGWVSNWNISSICHGRPGYGRYISKEGFAGLVDEKNGFKSEDGHFWGKRNIIHCIYKKMGGKNPEQHQLKDGWTKVMFSSS